MHWILPFRLLGRRVLMRGGLMRRIGSIGDSSSRRTGWTWRITRCFSDALAACLSALPRCSGLSTCDGDFSVLSQSVGRGSKPSRTHSVPGISSHMFNLRVALGCALECLSDECACLEIGFRHPFLVVPPEQSVLKPVVIHRLASWSVCAYGYDSSCGHYGRNR